MGSANFSQTGALSKRLMARGIGQHADALDVSGDVSRGAALALFGGALGVVVDNVEWTGARAMKVLMVDAAGATCNAAGWRHAGARSTADYAAGRETWSSRFREE